MTFFELLLITSLVASQAPPADGPAAIERARYLYDAASYEEALSLLIAIEDDRNVAEVEQYRALCLLALNRSAEAERALERIVVRNPFHRIAVSDISPRLVLMFREIRQRMLPAVVRSLFGRGKASFDAREYAQATVQLQEVVALLSEEESGTLGEGLPELRQVAEGMLSLSLAATAGNEPRSVLAAPSYGAIPPVGVAPGRAAVDPNRIYSNQDRGVAPPIEISRHVPAGVELEPNEKPRLYQGLIEVVIDRAGRVQSADVRRSVTASYDALLIESTRDWRFAPASINGVPVSYKKFFEVIVWGMSTRSAFGRP